MRRRIIPTRLIAITLAVALFLGNDYTIFPLAENIIKNNEESSAEQISMPTDDDGISSQSEEQPAVSTENSTGASNDGSNIQDAGVVDDNNTQGQNGGNPEYEGVQGENPENPENKDPENPENPNVSEECAEDQHVWEYNYDDNIRTCTVCGKEEKLTDENPGEDPNEGDGDGNEECADDQHVWGDSDPDTGLRSCTVCGKEEEQTEDENPDLCPDSPDGKHKWIVVGDIGTCIYCHIQKPIEEQTEPECEHEFDGDFDPETGDRTCIKCGQVIPCDHNWVTDPETDITTCSICGIEKPEECEHEWVTDPETGITTCIKCGIEKPEEEECEHEWIRDPETLAVVCGICGEIDEDYEEEGCPESEWGFHIYKENEDGTGYVCVLCGEEKEELDPLDVTEEMFLNSMYGINMLAMKNGVSYDSREASRFPQYGGTYTLQDLENYANKDDGYYTLEITCVGDLLVIEDWCQETDFSGWRFLIMQRTKGTTPNVGVSDYNWDLTSVATPNTEAKFSGWGTEEHPFAGTVQAVYRDNSNFTINTSFFKWLSTNATVDGMSFIGAMSTSTSSLSNNPMGLVAGTLVKEEDTDADCVTLKNVRLRGTVSSAKAAGMVFGKVEARNGTSITLFDDTAEITMGWNGTGYVYGLHAGGFAGETEGDVTVNINDPSVFSSNYTVTIYAGSASSWSTDGKLGDNYANTPAGGTFIGAMNKGILNIAPNSYKASVSTWRSYYGANGGLVGMAIGTEVNTTSSADSLITVTGSVSGYYAGGVLGYYEHPTEVNKQILNLEYINITASTSANYYAGGVLGRYYRNIADAKVDGVYETIDHITVSGMVYAGTSGGGVIGFVHGSNVKIGGDDPENTANERRISVSSRMYGGAMGGVAGTIVGQYVEIHNVSASPNFYYGSGSSSSNYASTQGGIIGYVGRNNETDKKTVVKIMDVSTSGTYGYYTYQDTRNRGGILGYVYPGNMVALDGLVNVSMSFTCYYSRNLYTLGTTGYIAGNQNEALIYFEENAQYSRGTASYTTDDIGNYGGVYRNGSWGESGQIFSYEEAKVLGKVGGSAGNWTIDSEADMIRLAVMLNTEGRFAADCFGYTPATNKGKLANEKLELLKATYTVSSPTGTLDLRGSGVYSLNRNDGTGFNQVFTGTFKGSRTGSGSLTINLGDITTRQAYIALFPQIGEGATISDFTLKRTINGVSLYGAGIACLSKGNVTLKNLYMDLTSDATPSLIGINGFYSSNSTYWDVYTGSSTPDLYITHQYFAGLVAKVEAGSDSTFAVENIKINGKIYGNHTYTSGSSYYYDYVQVGGMIADYTGTNTTISVNNIELMEKFGIQTATAYRFGGLIADINYSDTSAANKTTLFMRDIKIHNGASISQTSGSTTYSCGGWLGNVWRNVIPNKTAEGYYSVANLTIGDGGSAEAGPQYVVNYPFGGLVNTVTGRIQMKDTWIQNGVFNNAGSRDGVGLMFRLGHDAIIEIDGYRIADRGIDGNSANNNGGAVQFLKATGNYDEIVAYNMGTSTANHNDYKSGGIVNIIYKDFSDGKGNHKVYQNRLVEPNNVRRTRYYYNLFGSDFEHEDNYLGGTFDGKTVTNEKQMMIWHLNQYMNESIRRFLGVYYDGGTPIGRNQSTDFIASKIDLDTVSYYPTPIIGGSPKYTFGSDSGATEIVFHGQNITDAATAETMTPSSDKKEHYMLHAGLFLCKDDIEVTVQGKDINHFLVLSGSVSNLSGDTYTDNLVNQYSKNNSGSIFVRDIKGKKNIYYVRFNGLYLADYTNEDPAGLMLGIVKDGATLDISWIETRNYDTLFKRDKAASALIAVVGDYEASKISIEFKNMSLDSRIDGGIFMYASLIDENYYKEDTENASADIRRLRYLFTKEAWLGTDGNYYNPFNEANKDIYGENKYSSVGSYVTIGYELGEGVEYWNVDYGPENETNGGRSGTATNAKGETVNVYNMLKFVTGTFMWDQEYIEENYIPYVHRVQKHTSSKDIEVNPKNRSILKGCGTYEDPYIIEHPRQLLALSRYLQNKNDYKYLENWQIHDFEYGRLANEDAEARKQYVCNQNHTYTGQDDPEGTLRASDTQLRTYTFENGVVNPAFPTQEELSQAYYMIVGDIDLSNMSNATDRQIAEDFVGLGTSKIPFRGVIVGKIDKDSVTDTGDKANKDAEDGGQGRPTLTLPLKGYWTGSSKDVNYGLIQYSIGTVVKDLVIEASTEVDTTHERTGVAKVENKAAGVMAIVIGGDNIIDNVSVEAYITLMSTGCSAGAYAGIVEQGSLILRNIPEDCAEKFYIGEWKAPATDAKDVWDAFTKYDTAKLKKDYQYVSGLIGKVEDGCVIYDDVYSNKLYGKSVIGHSVADHNTGVTSENIAGIYSNDQNMPISNHYDIIVKSELDKDIDVNKSNKIEDSEKIQVTYDEANNEYTATVETSAQLQIVSMVINSDAFSIYPAAGGYKVEAACRKADYKYVGTKYGTKDEADSDRNKAVKEDDRIYYYPYLYQYFKFDISAGSAPSDGTRLGTAGWQSTLKEGRYPRKVKNDNGTTTTEYITGWTSTLNVAASDIDEVMNYELNYAKHSTKEDAYNLGQYCRGFRGIGATYGMITTETETSSYNGQNYGQYDKVDESATAFYSDFRANFNGNGAWIEIAMDKSYDQSIHTTALFNDLLDRTASKRDYFTIENFVLTGSSQSIVPEYDANDVDITNGDGAGGKGDTKQSYPNRTAAVVGMMRRPWRLSNIQLQDMTVTGKGHTGGFVAWIEPGGASEYKDASGTTVSIRDYEMVNCKLDETTKVYSYGGSAGGIIGVVMQNDPTASGSNTATSAANAVTVNLYGCQIIGKEGKEVEIAVKNRTVDPVSPYTSAGGYDYSTKQGVGRSGGFIGYVGRRNNVTSALLYVNVMIDNSSASDYVQAEDAQDAEVKYAKLTGAYSTGGLIGTYDAGYNASNSNTAGRTVTIKSAAVENCKVEGLRGNESTSDYYYTHGVGGLIGEMRGTSLTIQPSSSQNISLKDTTVFSSQTSGGYGLYAGGMVGCLKVYTGTFKGITMGEKNSSFDKVSAANVGTKGWVRSYLSDAGGIIGCASYGAGTLTMSGVQVIGMDISCDNRAENLRTAKQFGKTTASGTNGYVGGLIGTNHISLSVKPDTSAGLNFGAKVQECLITSPYYAVGGIVGIASTNEGYQTSSYASVIPTSISDVTVENNIIGFSNSYVFSNNQTSAIAGGVLGTMGSPGTYGSGATHRVENADIKSNWLYGFYAGGVLGYATGSNSVYSNKKESKDGDGDNGISVESNDIYGRYVGGVIGYGGSVSLNYYGTQITNNHLQAYGTGTTTAYVGGYAGYVSSSSAYYLDYIDVTGNDILAGCAPANNGYVSIYAGGLIGYVGTSTTKIYRPTLTNNNIGYSETGTDGGAGALMRTEPGTSEYRGFDTLEQLVKEMNVVTRKVSLLQGTGSSSLRPIDMPTSVADLTKNGIGYYGARIGNYIGSYSATNYSQSSSSATRNNHTYILAPVCSYAANVTRPVIDVGLATGTASGADPKANDDGTIDATLLTSPYAYRQNVHIIYHDYDANMTDEAKRWVGTSGDNYYVDNPHYNSTSSSTGNNEEDWRYLFEGMNYEKLIKDYQDVRKGNKTSVADYLNAYRLGFMVSETQSVEDVYTNLYKKNEVLVSNLQSEKGASGTKTVLPVIVLDTQFGTPDELMNGVIAALTGAGGVQSVYQFDSESKQYAYADQYKGIGTITSITAKPWKLEYTTGRLYETSGTPSLVPTKATASSSNNYSTGYTFTYDHFDDNGIDPDSLLSNPPVEKDQTFTMVTIVYSWSSNGQTRKETIHIPVFVEERLVIDTHLKISEGLEYNVEKASKGYYLEQITVASDSSYTFYTEYIYGEARKKYKGLTGGIGEKYIGTYSYDPVTGETPQKFGAGTRLTLIDIDAGNKVYYYTATGEEKGYIKYTDFTTEPGGNEHYQNKDIGDDTAGFLIVGKEGYSTEDVIEHTEKNADKGGRLEPKRGDNDLFETTTWKYENVAVERFLILVDISSELSYGELDPNSGTIREVAYPLVLKNGVRARTTLTEHTLLSLNIVQGMTIHFIQEFWDTTDPYTNGSHDSDTALKQFGERTWIGGTVTANDESGFVDIYAAIEVSASGVYWAAVRQSGANTIDSANHDKYLELQIYMTEENSEEEIMLPLGTFGYIEGERTRPEELGPEWFGDTYEDSDGYNHMVDMKVKKDDPNWYDNPDNVPPDHFDTTDLAPYYNVSDVYYYKDGRVVYKLNDLSKIIAATETRSTSADPANYRSRANRIVWVDHVRLDFRNADMSPFDKSRYTMHMNLLRIEDPEYPAGGEVKDSYSNQLPAVRDEELACALEAKNLMDLGINLYDNQTPIPHDIEFEFKMDFSGVMTGNDSTDEAMAQKYYTAAYRIWQKQFAEDGSYEYVPYNGEELTLELVGDPGDQLDKADEKALVQDTATVESSDGTKQEVKFWYTNYQFKWDEIKKGTEKYYGLNDGDAEDSTEQDGGTIEGDDETEEDSTGKGVILRDVKLTVNSVNELDLSNYKVQVILNVSDCGYNVPNVEMLKDFELNLDPDITPLTDFFVFTIAKLKTDLDY